MYFTVLIISKELRNYINFYENLIISLNQIVMQSYNLIKYSSKFSINTQTLFTKLINFVQRNLNKNVLSFRSFDSFLCSIHHGIPTISKLRSHRWMWRLIVQTDMQRKANKWIEYTNKAKIFFLIFDKALNLHANEKWFENFFDVNSWFLGFFISIHSKL